MNASMRHCKKGQSDQAGVPSIDMAAEITKTDRFQSLTDPPDVLHWSAKAAT